MLDQPKQPRIVTHWGSYNAVMEKGRPVRLDPVGIDPDPSPLAEGMIAALDAPARICRPAVRASFLAAREAGRIETEGAGRGYEPFVELPWDEALDLAASELDRVRQSYGNGAIYGGSYGWGSAGRFHHAQSQIHRFLNCIGGYTRSVQNYSYAAADMILPHVIGTRRGLSTHHTSWPRIAEQTETLVMFGGVPARNAQVGSGGIARHIVNENLAALRERGARMISVSPIRDDTIVEGVEWIPLRPNTDTALMLGMAHELLATGRADRAFLASHTHGADRLEAYVTGASDGTAKTPEWAAEITGVPAQTIRDLARDMAGTRSFLMMAWSLQRADGGEQPYWMAIALAAMLGQIGLPGGGFGFGYASVNGIGNPKAAFAFPALPQRVNPVKDYIPVARIADALLHPGAPYTFDGEDRTYPDLKLVYWAGGNPFHHHQDLNRLRDAWQRPETIIVHDHFWNALARHGDIVFPATTQLERNDIAFSSNDRFLSPSHAISAPHAEARDDFAIFTALAERLGAAEPFTEGRDVEGWLRHLYAQGTRTAAAAGVTLPAFDDFWTGDLMMLPEVPEAREADLLKAFREDPVAARLTTPSGKIQLYSEKIEGFGYDDCPPHPSWLPPQEWLGAEAARRFPLHLMSNQPKTKLHSQYDHTGTSRAAKRQGREVMRMHPQDAAERGLAEGDIVRVFNDRGACLASLALEEGLLRGVVQLATGAWFDPEPVGASSNGGPLDRQGNPNVLTADRGTSKLGQGPSAHSCLVEVEGFDAPLPEVSVFDPPPFVERG
ncbi:molybdopterin-dependent oxidoreductase [Pseudooceanicola sp. CBS1P-1]|uniref:Molybdopterin-dependent oxidoreductase n=1 Tax=Pseudooceanicola albus TaxID=2692189 RepID=A0A6L7GAR8_9RHOB|nr:MULTISPECIES: molybdopterin-dependent oxidoreductase [Pseudooceanicola]MBT9384399.1 molybdopterin-dependent oxidoreductase [Pseudooceanicola endophyticus]MXN19863.1 molybdopterin-dependent oxidoreductase [Pseudooceanicola albus]